MRKRRNKKRQGLFCILPIISCITITHAQQFSRLDSMFTNRINDQVIANAVGLVALNGKIVYDKAFGKLEDGQSVKTDAIYRIASQTKAITSVAAMMLYDEGKLRLDDPLASYFPAFSNMQVLDQYKEGDTTYTTKPSERLITIKDLLQHTAGFDYPEISGSFLAKLYNKSAIPAIYSTSAVLQDKINEIAKYPLMYQPGTTFNYSYSVDVLGAVIEKVSGVPLDVFFQQYLFGPLGMKDTYFSLPPAKAGRLIPMSVPGQAGQLSVWKKGTPGLDMDYPLKKGTFYAGGAGLVSTAHDYFILLQMLLDGGEYNGHRILKKETVQLMTTDQLQGKKTGYLGDNTWGLGFMVVTKSGSAATHLDEAAFTWAGAFGSYYWVDPGRRLVGVLFLNLAPFTAEDVRTQFKKIVYAELSR